MLNDSRYINLPEGALIMTPFAKIQEAKTILAEYNQNIAKAEADLDAVQGSPEVTVREKVQFHVEIERLKAEKAGFKRAYQHVLGAAIGDVLNKL